MTDRPHLTLVPPLSVASVPDAGKQQRAGDAIAGIDQALRDGPPDSIWRQTLFTLRRMLAAETAGPSPLRRVDQSDHPR